MKIIAKSPHIYLREYTRDDVPALHEILSNEITMQFWEKPFAIEETEEWLNRAIQSYEVNGFGRWAVVHTSEKIIIGDAGLMKTVINNLEEIDLGYIIHYPFWGNNYGYEAAKLCVDFAKEQLSPVSIVANMTHDNIRSTRVAQKLGMIFDTEFYNERNRKLKTLIYRPYV